MEDALTNEQLVLQIQSGQTELIPQLWKQCYKFIAMQARKYMVYFDGSSFDAEDMIQGAYEPFLQAIEKYQPDTEHTFISFLSLHIKNGFREVAGLRSERAEKQTAFENSMARLDAPIGENAEGESLTLLETVADDYAQDDMQAVEEADYQTGLHDRLEDLIEELPTAEQGYIHKQYYQNVPVKRIAEAANVSTVTVRNATQSLRNASKRTTAGLRLREFVSVADAYNFHSSGVSSFMREQMSETERAALRLIRSDCRLSSSC